MEKKLSAPATTIAAAWHGLAVPPPPVAIWQQHQHQHSNNTVRTCTCERKKNGNETKQEMRLTFNLPNGVLLIYLWNVEYSGETGMYGAATMNSIPVLQYCCFICY